MSDHTCKNCGHPEIFHDRPDAIRKCGQYSYDSGTKAIGYCSCPKFEPQPEGVR